MKTLLVLAAGSLQLPVIRTAKEMGLRVVVADGDPHAPGLVLGDVACCIDIVDAAECLTIARTYGVDGVIQICSEVSLNAVGVINEALGLCGINSAVAVRATNKRQMRLAFEDAGAPSVRSIEARDVEEAEAAIEQIGYPVIVKPTRNSGSRGITMLPSRPSKNQILASFQRALSASRDNAALVEQFVEGSEYSVEMLIWNGLAHVAAVTDKRTTGPPNFVETGHSQPTMLSNSNRDAVVNAAVQGVRALGINWSAVHAEVKLSSTGPVLIEIGARLGGDFITTELVPRSTGVNMVRGAIQLALGEEPTLTPEHPPGGACIRYLTPRPGKVVKIVGVDKARMMNGVRVLDVCVKPGDEVPVIDASTSRVGYVICEGSNATAAIANADAAQREIAIYTTDEKRGQSRNIC